MIKVLNQYFPARWVVLLLGESLLILLVLATMAGLQAGGWPSGAPPLGLVVKVAFIALLCQVCLHYRDLYPAEARSAAREVWMRLLQALGIATLVLALVYWVMPPARLETGVVMGSVLALLLLLSLWRGAIDWGIHLAHQAYPASERLLVLGAGEQARLLVRELRQRPQLGLVVVGAVTEEVGRGALPAGEGGLDGIPILGGLDQMAQIVAAQRPQRIAVALPDRRRWAAASLTAAQAAGAQIEDAPTLFERITGRVALSGIGPGWLATAAAGRRPRRLDAILHALGITTAGLGLLLLSPVLAAAAVAIRLDSPGPIFYRQTRVGLRGRCFPILKFRSMRVDAESLSGPVWAAAGDARITRVGRWLRKLRVDELPQLLNVLQGRMSIIGPRPERPQFVAEFRRSIPYYELRHWVRPGITGWAQVSRDYGASLDDARDKLEFDLYYVKNRSVWLDLFILFQTTKIIALGRGAR